MRQTRAFKKHALVPKPVCRDTIPAIPDWSLSWAIGRLADPERKAFSEIVENADLIEVAERQFILAEVTPNTLDVMAALGAEAEDRENDLEDEAEEDSDKDNDYAVDVVHEGTDCHGDPILRTIDDDYEPDESPH